MAKKEIKQGKTPVGKEARSKDLLSPLKPIWSFARLDVGGPWCFSKVAQSEITVVLSKLGHFEGMTWEELGHQKSHEVLVSQLAKQARDRLIELKQDDVDDLFSFRLEGSVRVWGIRRLNVIQVLWWDPEHKVWPYVKKHT